MGACSLDLAAIVKKRADISIRSAVFLNQPFKTFKFTTIEKNQGAFLRGNHGQEKMV